MKVIILAGGWGSRLGQQTENIPKPMINIGGHNVVVLDDDWTVVTKDGTLSAHFEDSIAITEDGPVVLSRL